MQTGALSSKPPMYKSVISIVDKVLEKVQEGNAYYFRLECYEGKTFYAYSSIIPKVRGLPKQSKFHSTKLTTILLPAVIIKNLDNLISFRRYHCVFYVGVFFCIVKKLYSEYGYK